MICQPIGPRNAKIVIIGEAPGSEEEKTGIPFTGTSGELLTQVLAKVGLSREELYITNVVKVRPPDNKIDRLGELGVTVESFYPLLFKELREVKPNVIIALGATPLQALCKQESITKWRGSILEWEGIKVLPSIHPAACLRQWQWVYLLQFDLQRAVKESGFPELRKKEREYVINPSFHQIKAELKRIKNESTFLTIDLETYMRSGVLKMIGLADSESRAFCIPLVKGLKTLWSHIEEREIWTLLFDILTDPSKKIIAQNAQFEMSQLESYTGGRMRIFLDTMRAHALLYPELPHSLAFLTSIYTDIPYYKDEGKASSDKGSYDILQTYNCKDCCSTFEIAMKEIEELQEIGMWEFYQEYDIPLLHELRAISKRGVKIDLGALSRHRINTKSRLNWLQSTLNKRVGYELNVKSVKSMQKFLYQELGLPKKFNKKTGNITTDADALEKLWNTYRKTELKLVLRIRELRTLAETFLNIGLDSENRIHTTYGLTETGRLSSGADIFESGTNLQNIPKGIRDIFIPFND